MHILNKILIIIDRLTIVAFFVILGCFAIVKSLPMAVVMFVLAAAMA